jgi:hypothetical protein
VCAGLAVAVGACGAGHKAQEGRLPAQAKVVFSSDSPVSDVVGSATRGSLIASLGFNPTLDGFSFQNYGFVAGSDLDQHAMRELFGDVVCATTPSDSCTLTPLAQQWAQQKTPSMWGGHCYGFSMTALRFFRHLLSPSQFGGTTTYSLSLTPALQSEIAYAWVTQLLPDVVDSWRVESATQMVDFLRGALARRGESYSIGIRNGFGPGTDGHVITPIGVKALGGGHDQILVYDNNDPGVTRAIDVDENNNSWSYELFPGTVWRGAGGDNLSDNPMIIEPLSATLQRHPCPFCTATAGAMTTISLGGDPTAHGHLLITASDGRRLGFFHGRFVNQIKGARIMRTYLNEDWKAVPEPIYEVPSRDRVTVTLQPSSATFPQNIDVTTPGFGATVSNLRTGTSSAVQISLAGTAPKLGLRVLGGKLAASPTVELTGGTGRVGNQLLATPKSLSPGSTLELTLASASNRGSVRSTAPVSGVAVTLTHVGSAGSRVLQSKSVRLAPTHSTTF